MTRQRNNEKLVCRCTVKQFHSWILIWKKKIENTNSKRHLKPSVQSSIIYSCQGMEATEVSICR